MNKQLNPRLLTELCVRAGRYKAAAAANAALAANYLIGVEIELEEFAGDADRARANGWVIHEDGSLVNGMEFVLHPPRNGNDLVAGIDHFFNCKFKYTGGDRTSVHLHVDMTDGVTVGQFRSLFCLTFLLEGAIYRIADEHRKWGGYSSPLIDMSPARMNQLLAGNTEAQFSAGVTGKIHEDKYYGFNSVSLTKHGTMEFRYFPCTDDKKVLMQWVNLVLELKAAAMLHPDPDDLLKAFSDDAAAVAWLKKFMPKSTEGLLQYADRVDMLDRKRLLVAVMHDKNAAAYRAPAPQVSKSLKKLAVKRGWAHEDNGADVEQNAAPINPVRIEEIYEADGQINMAAYQQLVQNIQQRNRQRR